MDATKGLDKSPEKDLKAGTVQMDVENIPPFDPEEQMPPESDYRLKIRFFYTSAYTSSPSNTCRNR